MTERSRGAALVRRSFILGTAVCGLSALAAPEAYAHQLKAGLVRVLFNGRTGLIEVMHRYYAHDAEHAVERLFGPGADIRSVEADLKRFSAYVVERFGLADAGGGPISLRYLGEEFDGPFLWIYQDAPLPDGIEGLRVRNAVLHDVWEDQTNLVNIEGRGETLSATFAKGEGARKLLFKTDGQP
ncbi:MAG: DUF6702 family protein [Pseudomonadota bacterium]